MAGQLMAVSDATRAVCVDALGAVRRKESVRRGHEKADGHARFTQARARGLETLGLCVFGTCPGFQAAAGSRASASRALMCWSMACSAARRGGGVGGALVTCRFERDADYITGQVARYLDQARARLARTVAPPGRN
jgi:hypothetical protein